MKIRAVLKSKDLQSLTREELIELIGELNEKLKIKGLSLHKTRLKLNAARKKLTQCKDTVTFQRRRIIELHK